MLDNADALSQLGERQLFRADVRPEHMWWMLVQLHMPQRVLVDLPEFLEGAKLAAEAQLRAVNSEEFAEFAAGRRAESEAAERLQSFCSPRTFEGVRSAARHMLEDRNMLLELQELEVEAVQVTDVRYAQLTETQLEALLAGLPRLPTLWAGDSSVEFLQVEVAMRTSEVTRMTLVGVEEVLARQTNVRTWRFGSRANSEQQLEWRVLDTFAVNESASQLSRTVFADAEAVEEAAGAANEAAGEPAAAADDQQQRGSFKQDK